MSPVCCSSVIPEASSVSTFATFAATEASTVPVGRSLRLSSDSSAALRERDLDLEPALELESSAPFFAPDLDFLPVSSGSSSPKSSSASDSASVSSFSGLALAGALVLAFPRSVSSGSSSPKSESASESASAASSSSLALERRLELREERAVPAFERDLEREAFLPLAGSSSSSSAPKAEPESSSSSSALLALERRPEAPDVRDLREDADEPRLEREPFFAVASSSESAVLRSMLFICTYFRKTSSFRTSTSLVLRSTLMTFAFFSSRSCLEVN